MIKDLEFLRKKGKDWALGFLVAPDCKMNRKNIKTQTIFVFFSKYISVFIILVVNAVLARILSPEEFGIVAAISVFITFFNIVADIGIGSAIVQNRELSQNDVDMLFTLTLYFSMFLTVFFIIFSFGIAGFYGNDVYIRIGAALSLSLFFNALNTVPNAVLMKNEKFVSVGIRTITSNLFSGLCAIYFALRGVGYYSLVIQSVCCSAMIFIWNFSNTRLRIRKKIDFSCVKKVKDFSVYWFGFNVFNYFARNVDNLLTGKFLGATALGYYDKAYKLMLYPVQNLTYVLNPILHPILAKYQTDLKIVYRNYVKVLKILSIIGIYIEAFCLFNGREIIFVIFGKQWENAIQAFKILSISIWFQITNSSTGAIYASINKTKLMLKSGMIYIPIQILLVIIAIGRKRIEAIAVAAATGLIIKFFIDYIILIKRGFKYSFVKFLENFKMEPVLFIVCYCSMIVGRRIEIESNIIVLIYNLVLSGSTFVIALLVTRQIKYLKI